MKWLKTTDAFDGGGGSKPKGWQTTFLIIIEKHILMTWNVPLFNYYISKLGCVCIDCSDNAGTGGWGVQNQGKLADIILGHSLRWTDKHEVYQFIYFI